MSKTVTLFLLLLCLLTGFAFAGVDHNCDVPPWVHDEHDGVGCSNFAIYSWGDTYPGQCHNAVTTENGLTLKDTYLQCCPTCANGSPGCSWDLNVKCGTSRKFEHFAIPMINGKYPRCFEDPGTQPGVSADEFTCSHDYPNNAMSYTCECYHTTPNGPVDWQCVHR